MTITETDRPTIEQLTAMVEAAAGPVAGLVEMQAAYDVDGFRIGPPRQPQAYKVRHMLYHLRKALQRIDGEIEDWEHRELDSGEGGPDDAEVGETIADHGLVAAELLFGALQLAEIGDIDLVGAYRDLLARNARRFIPDSAFAELPQVVYTGGFNK